jgi:hypothetical protein
MEDKERRKLAMEIATGKVFGSWMVPKGQEQMLSSIFIVLVLGGKLPEDTAQVYEYYSEAGPLSVNGYPIFFSCRVIKQDDWEKLIPLVNKAIDMQKEFVGEPENGEVQESD